MALFKFECDQLFLSQVHENEKCRYNYHNKENIPHAKMDLNCLIDLVFKTKKVKSLLSRTKSMKLF